MLPPGFSHQMYAHGSVLCQQSKHGPCLLTIIAVCILLAVDCVCAVKGQGGRCV